ncbi:hypothetical protein BIY37_04695 [Candidatus Brocadia sapporoensis]|uniref:Uncharacterized protein n=1 Tax=Candidatus Brocadia sapporoensis TaxID=392547 RepID=A0A1V6M144_9BACT|nr:hypothetical protein BIY37_04695 [Candidatus Brocadia sapporoensis]
MRRDQRLAPLLAAGKAYGADAQDAKKYEQRETGFGVHGFFPPKKFFLKKFRVGRSPTRNRR